VTEHFFNYTYRHVVSRWLSVLDPSTSTHVTSDYNYCRVSLASMHVSYKNREPQTPWSDDPRCVLWYGLLPKVAYVPKSKRLYTQKISSKSVLNSMDVAKCMGIMFWISSIQTLMRMTFVYIPSAVDPENSKKSAKSPHRFVYLAHKRTNKRDRLHYITHLPTLAGGWGCYVWYTSQEKQ